MCELFFGTSELPDRHRELRLVRALSDHLVVEPRDVSNAAERAAILDLVACCFPGGVDFLVRASEQWIVRSNGELSHKVQTNPETLACESSCDPLNAFKDGRVFEIACDGDGCAAPDGDVVLGPSEFSDEPAAAAAEGSSRALSQVCVLDTHPLGGVQPGGPGSQCIYAGLTARFAVYRGLAPSERDMMFTWNTVGGFAPLAVDLFAVTLFRTTTSPEKMVYVPQINRLVIADGGSTGLFFVGLRRATGGPGLSSSFAY